jgi:SnoaL-like polyketide cyclase
VREVWQRQDAHRRTIRQPAAHSPSVRRVRARVLSSAGLTVVAAVRELTGALIEQYYRCFNERRLADAAALFTDDAEIEFAPGKPEHGGQGYLRVAQAWLRAFPNAHVIVERIERRNDTVSEVYLVGTGTHRDTLEFGVYRFKASGTDAVLHIRELLDVQNGKITASAVTIDTNDLIGQLTQIDYIELGKRLDRICGLRDALARAGGDTERRRELANQIGFELDAARRTVRPHFFSDLHA